MESKRKYTPKKTSPLSQGESEEELNSKNDERLLKEYGELRSYIMSFPLKHGMVPASEINRFLNELRAKILEIDHVLLPLP